MDNLFKNGISSLFEAAKNLATGVDQSVPVEVHAVRIETCNGCPKLMVTRQCGACLCFVDLKTKLRQEKCPLDKWSSHS